MRILTIIVLFYFGTSVFQKKHKIDFVGTWKVIQVDVDPNSPMAKNMSVLSMMRSSMSQVIFIFQANHHVAMGGATPQQQLPDGLWSYNPANKQLDIKSGTGNDKRTVSMIATQDVNGQVFFKMVNAPITLRVAKQ